MQVPCNIWEALTAVGTIAVAIAAIWGEWIKTKLLGPKLKLVFEDQNGDIRTEFIPGGAGGSTRKAIYFLLHVRNDRLMSVATNCKVLLREVHRKLPNGDFYKEPIPAPLQYWWYSPSYEAPEYLDLPEMQMIRHDAYIDFIRIIQGGEKFEAAARAPSTAQFIISGKGEEVVRYSLQIVADNFVSRQLQIFEVEWNGHLGNNLDELRNSQTMIPCIKIREVSQAEQKQMNYADPNLNPSPLDPR